MSGVRLPATYVCYTIQLELGEFYKQLNDLLTFRLIRPAKTLVSDHSNAVERPQTNNFMEGRR